MSPRASPARSPVIPAHSRNEKSKSAQSARHVDCLACGIAEIVCQLKSCEGHRRRHILNRQTTFPRMKTPTTASTAETIQRKLARGVTWASFAPPQDPTVRRQPERSAELKIKLSVQKVSKRRHDRNRQLNDLAESDGHEHRYSHRHEDWHQHQRPPCSADGRQEAGQSADGKKHSVGNSMPVSISRSLRSQRVEPRRQREQAKACFKHHGINHAHGPCAGKRRRCRAGAQPCCRAPPDRLVVSKNRRRDESRQDIRHHRRRNADLNWDAGKKHECRNENDAANSDAADHQAGREPEKHDPDQFLNTHRRPHLARSASRSLQRDMIVRCTTDCSNDFSFISEFPLISIHVPTSHRVI